MEIGEEKLNLQITEEMCSHYLTRLNDIGGISDSLIQDNNRVMQRCTQLEEENKLLKEQLENIRHVELDELVKENVKLKKIIQDSKQKEEIMNSNFIKMAQTCETIYKKMSTVTFGTVPLAASGISTQSTTNDALSTQVFNATMILDAPETSNTILDFCSNENSENTIQSGTSDVVTDNELTTKDVNNVPQSKEVIPNNTNVEAEIALPDGSNVQKSSEEKANVKECSVPLNNLSEDVKRMDKYNAVAAKRKLANEIAYSEAKKIKPNEISYSEDKTPNDNVDDSPSLVIDMSDGEEPATPEKPPGASMSIFTQRKLGSVMNRIEAPKEQHHERKSPPKESDHSSNSFSKMSVKDPRLNRKSIDDHDHFDKDSRRSSNSRNDKSYSNHKSRSKGRFDRDNRY